MQGSEYIMTGQYLILKCYHISEILVETTSDMKDGIK